MHEAPLVSFSFRIYIFFSLLHGPFPPLPCLLRVRIMSTQNPPTRRNIRQRVKPKRGSQKRGNCRQVIPLHKLVSVVQAGTFASQGERRPLRKGVRENGTALFGLSMLTQGDKMGMHPAWRAVCECKHIGRLIASYYVAILNNVNILYYILQKGMIVCRKLFNKLLMTMKGKTCD